VLHTQPNLGPALNSSVPTQKKKKGIKRQIGELHNTHSKELSSHRRQRATAELQIRNPAEWIIPTSGTESFGEESLSLI